jgi:hypothetical protein
MRIAKLRDNELSDNAKECMHIPCSEGGLGITKMDTIDDAAYVASYIALCLQKVHERTKREDFKLLYDENLIGSVPEPEDPFYHLKQAASNIHQQINLRELIHNNTRLTEAQTQSPQQQNTSQTTAPETTENASQTQQSTQQTITNIKVTLHSLAEAKITQSIITKEIIKQKTKNFYTKFNQLAAQQALTPQAKNHLEHLLNSKGPERARARNAIPFNASLKIPNVSIQNDIRETLGANLTYASTTGFCENCNMPDRGGRHQQACKCGHVSKITHKHLEKIIGELGDAAGVGPTIYEPKLIDETQTATETHTRRADHLWPLFDDDGDPMYTDVSVAQTTVPTNQAMIPKQGHQAALKYALKITKYKDLCKANGGDFAPLIFESSGYWHPKTKQIIKYLAAKTATQTTGNENPSLIASIYRYWATKISVAILKDTYFYGNSNTNAKAKKHLYHYY